MNVYIQPSRSINNAPSHAISSSRLGPPYNPFPLYSGIGLPEGTCCSSFLAPQVNGEYQLDLLFSLTASWFSWTSRSGRGLPPANDVVCLSEWFRGGDCDGGVDMDNSPDSPLKLDVSLRIPGKLPLVATDAPEGTRAAALGLPELLGGEKKVWECRGVPSGGETGPSGPRYIWLTRLAAPVNWSDCGRGLRLVLVDLDNPMGMLGALSGSVWSEEVEGWMTEIGRGLGLVGPTAIDLARWSMVPDGCSCCCLLAGAGGSSLLVSGRLFKSLDVSRIDSKSWC